jgi:alanyl-tRNA synthetase
LTGEEIKRLFLEFFRERGHRVVESSSLIPDDPTLLLTNAGMVQFKPYFLGELQPEYTRATSAQKCVRTTDIDKVGYTARHLTFFEMLGNFSFGDYYKREAAQWAWDFLVGVLGLPLERLYFTIYEEDDEAYDVWRDVVGVPEERIVRLGEKDNFWDMGVTGPCGPCSEIIYDQGPEMGCREPDCRVGCDCDRYLELWNLVFMQFHRDEQGKLYPLPKKNIDTGMGLERVTAVLQGVGNNFECDLVRPLIERMVDIAGVKYGADPHSDTSLKVIADHSRAMTFLISDGVLPSNEERGYVLRRIVRRAVRHGRRLGVENLFLPGMVDMVIELHGESYPDLKKNRAFIESIVRSEEERFSQTLRTGLSYLEVSLEELVARGERVLPGEVAFHLHDTLGFPLELTREIVSEQGVLIDEERFNRLMEDQKERARQARASEGYALAEKVIYLEVLDNYGTTDFDGYGLTEETARVKALIQSNHAVASAGEGEEVEVVLDRTPFYAEMGGQVGDCGWLLVGGTEVRIDDTQQPLKGLYIHKGRVIRGSIRVGDEVLARVDGRRRNGIRRNHTATHLIHWALRKVLGEHAKQAGSLVDAERLRFDFTHYAPLTLDELNQIERLVNQMVIADLPVRAYFTTYDYARSIDAIALFGEKYEEHVRVVEVDEISRELCGGTHVGRTGEIGLCLFTAEGSVGANLRRLEAVTGEYAYAKVKEMARQLEEISRMVKADVQQLVPRLEKMIQHQKTLEEELERRSREELGELVEKVVYEGETWANERYRVLIAQVGKLNSRRLRDVAERVLERIRPGVVAIAAMGEKVELVVAVSRDLLDRGLNAVELARAGAKSLGGGGGGRPDMAVGGGPRREGVKEALRIIGDKAIALLADNDA